MKRILLICFILVASLINEAFAQGRTVSGTVTSEEDGLGMPGVTVVLKGTTTGVQTDFDGKYSLEVPADGGVLVFSFVGMATQEAQVGARSVIDVQMAADVKQLSEVVVTAFGVAREKKALGYAVQEVKGDALVNAKETNVVSALAGKTAGVQITNSSGAAGGASYIKIRGNASLTGNNQPLFVVDGVPINNSQQMSEDLRGGVALSNRAIDINPDDIADLSVLKGGAAAALYGSRGANGVILITTKKGSPNQGFKVGYTGSVEFSEVNKLPPIQTTYGQGLYQQYTSPEDGLPYSYGPKISDLRFDSNGNIVHKDDASATNEAVPAFNNAEDFFQTGIKTEHAINLSGGKENLTYFASVARLDQESIIPENTFERTSLRVSTTAKLNKFSVDQSVAYVNSGGRRIQQGSNTSGLMLGLLRTAPTFDNSNGVSDPTDPRSYLMPDGTQRNYRGGGGYDNPYWAINQNPFHDNVNRVMGYMKVGYQPFDFLNVSYRLGADVISDKRTQVFAIRSATLPDGQIIEDAYFNSEVNGDFLVNFNKTFNENIGVNVTVGHNFNIRKMENNYTQGDVLVIPDFYNLSNASTVTGAIDFSEMRTTGLFMEASVDYNSTYFLSVTARRDAASTFGAATENSFFYPSVSGSFVFSELMPDLDWFTFGKLRGSWATVGNQPGVYVTKTYFTQAAAPSSSWTGLLTYPFNGQVGYSHSDVIGNTQLRPEKVTSKEIGAELKFFNNRLGLDVTYYDQLSEDLIISAPVAASSGYSNMWINAGVMSNKGVELALYANPIKAGDFSWDVGVNWTRNRNIVEELAEGVEVINLPWGFTGASQRLVKGEAYGTLYGSVWLKDDDGNVLIDPSTGYPLVDPEDNIIGDPNPDWLAGITNTFTYKNFTLSALIDIRKGGDIWNGTKGALYFFGTHADTGNDRYSSFVFPGVYFEDGTDPHGNDVSAGATNTTTVVKDIDWYASGPGSGFTGPSEPYIEDGGWVRLREVSLTYKLGSRLIKKVPFSDASFTITGRNLWLSTDYTGIDPETNLAGTTNAQGADYFNMPNTKGVSATLRITL
ncbi:SusC/RagA family TonB-linked outer membrane protein [Xanthovirga aplysinae]|uniref:SusC/RagA family TonB-linked outer membrane protein n=1 Tax=Xanthovirga aplysinae TaxID=2529853 RepID=UPI0012BC4655|nr:SusC/RagA family TonB-linked outer membrane protein [Xanthovirga aplysinae]MTI31434.1 SusC/RagA family TonB-linked outer membrane protein [Xanthovirga aplysinae]